MKITAEQYAIALWDTLMETKASDHEKVLDNFIQVLSQTGQLDMVSAIEEALVIYEQRLHGQTPAQVTFARPGHSEQKLLNDLNSLLGADLALKKRVDEGIVGGVVIETEDQRIDASIKTKLKKLKDALIN